MCWRDDISRWRVCSFCGQDYYDDLGHRNCPKFQEEESDSLSGTEDDSSNTNEPEEIVASEAN